MPASIKRITLHAPGPVCQPACAREPTEKARRGRATKPRSGEATEIRAATMREPTRPGGLRPRAMIEPRRHGGTKARRGSATEGAIRIPVAPVFNRCIEQGARTALLRPARGPAARPTPKGGVNASGGACISGGGGISSAFRVLLIPLLGMILAGCQRPSAPLYCVSLAGAQVPVELVQSWLEASDAPRFAVRQVTPVQLSQIGFEKLAAGECTLACTDRPITQRELPQFGRHELLGQRVGFYGYALYVNQQNPLDSVFAGHLPLVFQRKVTDWEQLFGGPDAAFEGPIRLVGPAKSTRGGEILARQARIWFDDPTWEVLPGDVAVINAVASDPLALGFASVGYDGDGVRYLGLRMQRTGRPAFPSLEEIESEQYGLAKVIYLYAVQPLSPPAAAARAYLQSDAGRRAMAETQVWPIPAERATVRPTP